MGTVVSVAGATGGGIPRVTGGSSARGGGLNCHRTPYVSVSRGAACQVSCANIDNSWSKPAAFWAWAIVTLKLLLSRSVMLEAVMLTLVGAPLRRGVSRR